MKRPGVTKAVCSFYWFHASVHAVMGAFAVLSLPGVHEDDMIVSGGENVYPCALENVLAQHPDVGSVAVYGIPDEEFGQRLKAVVVKKRRTMLSQSTLLDWLRPRVARYQMPAAVEFRDELARTSIGKLDKKSL